VQISSKQPFSQQGLDIPAAGNCKVSYYLFFYSQCEQKCINFTWKKTKQNKTKKGKTKNQKPKQNKKEPICQSCIYNYWAARMGNIQSRNEEQHSF